MGDGEWFEAIGGWTQRQRRTAIGFAIAFFGFLVTAIVLWLLAPPAPGQVHAPWPGWRSDEFRSGETMRKLERHLKESSWVTFGLRRLHDAVLELAGMPRHRATLGTYHYETAAGQVMAPDDSATWLEALERGFLVTVPWPMPRHRIMVGPDQAFYLCYADNEVLHREWFDRRGRVLVELNRYGMRDRDDLTEAKPAGERRVLCLGDSITMAWGVPVDRGWTRLLEAELRQRDPRIRTVNAGGAGTVCVDEYWWALQHRFASFEPDAVVVAIGLGDLVPSNGLAVFGPAPRAGQQHAVLDPTSARDPLDLDPTFDWVEWLLHLPKEAGEQRGLYGYDKPFEAMWSQGAPQAALRSMRDWCEARKIPFVVTLWPFLQGLGGGRQYPFEHLHALVRAQCETDGIPFVDLLPALRGVDAEDLWVTPADMHPNPLAHRLAVPPIRDAVADALGL